jgi:hypothetical protein
MSITSNRLKLLAILALFILPLVLAALMFAGKIPLLSSETVNQGRLIQPPVPLDWNAAGIAAGGTSQEDLPGNWVILLPVPVSCGPDCLDKATGLRQVHRAAGREQQRIRLVLLREAAWDEASIQRFLGIYDQFVLMLDPDLALSGQLQMATANSHAEPGAITSYLVDPLGNIMMAYDTADSETRMSKDLKRLLKWSKQDEG